MLCIKICLQKRKKEIKFKIYIIYDNLGLTLYILLS